MKIIFVTGGAISGLGKGITSASIGKMMKSAGLTVGMVKIDPYLQVDAGTMSPYEHGEVFVTDDGGETDLDLGNYERFTGAKLTKDSNITTGKVYLNVINKERNGDYLGQTVQIIPHITNEIKDNILLTANNYDVTVVEVGGTVGDIESQPFLESIRQMRDEYGSKNIAFVHVAPLLYLSYSGEIKTKLVQHSVIKLREFGILPDIIVARSEVSIDESIKAKISRFCGTPVSNVIEALNVKSIYQVPEKFREQNLDKILFKQFELDNRKSDLKKWGKLVDKIVNPKEIINIAVIGKYVEFEDTYKSINESLIHGGVANNIKINAIWISSENKDKLKIKLIELNNNKEIHGILIPGGFGERGVEGKIYASKFSRENKIPYLGICLGMQVAVIDFARNVCKLKDCHSTEFDEKTCNPVIDYMETQKKITAKGGTMRLGSYDAILEKGSLAASLYGSNEVSERHRHRYEVNIKYHDILRKNGLKISGLSPDKTLVEFIEIEDHPFYIATQAHPEFKSRLEKPHPLFVGLIRSALLHKR